MTVISQIPPLLLVLEISRFLASTEPLISPRRSKGDDPLCLPCPLLFAFSYTGCTMVERAATKG